MPFYLKLVPYATWHVYLVEAQDEYEAPRRWQESILNCCGGHFMQNLIACSTKPSFFFFFGAQS
jgi:hypothetical protein